MVSDIVPNRLFKTKTAELKPKSALNSLYYETTIFTVFFIDTKSLVFWHLILISFEINIFSASVDTVQSIANFERYNVITYNLKTLPCIKMEDLPQL